MLKITPLPSKIPAHVVLYPRLLKRIQPLPSTKNCQHAFISPPMMIAGALLH